MGPDSRKKTILKILICLVAGSMLPVAFAPFHYSLITLIAPAILFYHWLNTPPRLACAYGYAFGFGMFGTGVYWLHISINMFGGVNLIGAICITYLLVAFLALYPALVGYIARKYFCVNDVVFLLLVIPALWTIAEWCRSWILTGITWLNLGYSQVDSPLAGLAPITGVYGISWLVGVSAAALTYIFITKTKWKIITIVSLVLVWSVLGSIKDIAWTEPKDKEITVALVQGAIPQELKWQKETQQHTLDLYLSLSEPYWDNDLIIWPETAIPAFFHQASFFIEPLETLVQQHETDLLTGIATKDSDKYFNSIISIGKYDDIYNKRHLVPFGEYIPLGKWLRPLFRFLQIPMSNFSASLNDKPLMKAAGEQIGISICYEDTFGEEVIDALPEAGILVNISNDAWFGDSIAPHQHLQMARMRSLETGRYLLRATNTGISAIINEKGEIISRSPQFVPHAISEQVRIFEGATPYATFGNSLVLAPAILLLLTIFTNVTRRKNTG